MTTEIPINGSGPTEERAQAMLQTSVDAFARAFVQSRSVGDQLNFNAVNVMVQVELQKLQFALLLEVLSTAGMINGVAWRAVLAQRLDELREQLSGPRIAIATGRAVKGN